MKIAVHAVKDIRLSEVSLLPAEDACILLGHLVAADKIPAAPPSKAPGGTLAEIDKDTMIRIRAQARMDEDSRTEKAADAVLALLSRDGMERMSVLTRRVDQ